MQRAVAAQVGLWAFFRNGLTYLSHVPLLVDGAPVHHRERASDRQFFATLNLHSSTCAQVCTTMHPTAVLTAVLAAGAALAGWTTLKAVDAAPPEALAQFPLPLAALVHLRSTVASAVARISHIAGSGVASELAGANGIAVARGGPAGVANVTPASRQLFSIFDRFFGDTDSEDEVLARWAQVIPGTQSQVRWSAAPVPGPDPRHAPPKQLLADGSSVPGSTPHAATVLQRYRVQASAPVPPHRRSFALHVRCRTHSDLLSHLSACDRRFPPLTRAIMPRALPCMGQHAGPRWSVRRSGPRRMEWRPSARHVDLPA